MVSLDITIMLSVHVLKNVCFLDSFRSLKCFFSGLIRRYDNLFRTILNITVTYTTHDKNQNFTSKIKIKCTIFGTLNISFVLAYVLRRHFSSFCVISSVSRECGPLFLHTHNKSNLKNYTSIPFNFKKRH